MASNPLVPQGTLSRLRASVIWADFPELNVTASFLNRDGIRFAPEGDSTLFLPSMTGAVTSQEPYQMVGITLNLLRTQNLADQYKRKWQTDSQLGVGTVRPDTIALSPFEIINCAIEGVGELGMAGQDAGYPVRIKGYMLVNSDLFNL